jgi:hypothetical protein
MLSHILLAIRVVENVLQVLICSFAGVSDPVKKRNRRRTLEERKNPLVVKKEEQLKKQGIVK